jgi:hypothetical protein
MTELDQKIPIPGGTGSLLMMLLKFNRETDPVYWKNTHGSWLAKSRIVEAKGQEC